MNILTEVAASNNIWYDIVLIGLGIIATLIGGIGMKLLETRFNKIGKISMYYMIVEFDRIPNDEVTFRIQIKNPSRDVKFLRDISLREVYDGKIKKAESIINMRVKNNGEIKEEKTYANNGSYAITAEPRSLVEYELKFIFIEKINIDSKFLLTYIDDSEQIQAIKVDLKTNTNWIVADIKKGDGKNV